MKKIKKLLRVKRKTEETLIVKRKNKEAPIRVKRRIKETRSSKENMSGNRLTNISEEIIEFL